MRQRLFIEGKDYFAIGEIAQKNKLPIPKGYTVRDASKFMVGGDGFDATLEKFVAAWESENFTNLGLIVDADELGANARLDKIAHALGVEIALAERLTEGCLFKEKVLTLVFG